MRYLKCYCECRWKGLYIVRMSIVDLLKTPLSWLYKVFCKTGTSLVTKILLAEELSDIGVMEDFFPKHLLSGYS